MWLVIEARSDAVKRLIGKESDAGRDRGQEEKGTTEDEMAGWHHRLDGRESQWTPGVGDGVLRFMGSQRVRHDWATDLIWSVFQDILLGKNRQSLMIYSNQCEQMKCHVIALDKTEVSSCLVWNTVWFFPMKTVFPPNNYVNEFAFSEHMPTALWDSKKMWQVEGRGENKAYKINMCVCECVYIHTYIYVYTHIISNR